MYANFKRLGYSVRLTPPRTSSASMLCCLAQTSAWVLRRTLAAATAQCARGSHSSAVVAPLKVLFAGCEAFARLCVKSGSIKRDLLHRLVSAFQVIPPRGLLRTRRHRIKKTNPSQFRPPSHRSWVTPSSRTLQTWFSSAVSTPIAPLAIYSLSRPISSCLPRPTLAPAPGQYVLSGSRLCLFRLPSSAAHIYTLVFCQAVHRAHIRDGDDVGRKRGCALRHSSATTCACKREDG